MNIGKSPSIIRIIWVDLVAALGAGLIVGSWIFLAIQLMFPESSTHLLETSISLMILGIPIGVWRIYTIMSIFNEGVAVPGIINSVWFFQGRGRVEYIYSYRGQKYLGGNAILKSRFTRILESQENVTVLIDVTNPKRAFIQELYA